MITRPKTEVPSLKIPRLPGISIPFSKSKGSYTVHVLIRPPMYVGVTFKVKKKLQNGKWSKEVCSIHHYKIQVPWQAFMVRMNRMGAIMDTFMWFLQEKPEDVDTLVYMPPLPNIYPSGHICNGTIKVDFKDPPYLKVEKAFEAFWMTPFTEETWPENNDLIPSCWDSRSGHYHIEYGFLRFVFEYWQEHDEKHFGNKWKERWGSCSSFPWGVFQILNKAHPDYSDRVRTLDDAMQYALTFVPMKRQD